MRFGERQRPHADHLAGIGADDRGAEDLALQVHHQLDVARGLALGLGAVVLGEAASAGCVSPRLSAIASASVSPTWASLGIGEGDPRDDVRGSHLPTGGTAAPG